MSATYSTALLPQHAAMLAASGITAEHASARGYVSVDERTWFKRQGLTVTRAGQRVPGLLVPQRRADGSVWGYQYRPDDPRQRDGKPVKYETPTGQRNSIDVPPGVGPMLGDPAIPLWVTEGVKKADAGALAGLCIVALPGVWSWRGSNDRGGKVAVPDWHDIALNGRRVVLAFDSDVARKRSVRQALDALAGYLSSKGASVEFCHLPDDDLGKTGLDDFLADGHTADDLRALVRPEPPAVVEAKVTGHTKVTDSSPLTSNVTSVTLVTPPGQRKGIHGDTLLDDLTATLRRFVAFPSPGAAEAVALWVVHTHCLDAFDSSPRLAILSPEPQSGKTRTMELLEYLADRSMFTTNTTVAVLARGLDAGTYRAILLDEADTVFGSKAHGDEELRGLLNSGHRRGATYMRMVGEGTNMAAKSFSTFSAVALAGLGDLPETVMQRAVVLRMRRRSPQEHVEPFRRRQHGPMLEELWANVSAWAQWHAQSLMNRWPEMPEGVSDRPADVWEPLLAIADEAGGHWPATARSACVDLLRAAQTVDSGSLGVRLLADLRIVWQSAGDPDGMHTDTMLSKLIELDEAPWADLRGKPLDARGLARRLRTYGTESKSVRVGEVARKGYRREDLHDAWSRYLPRDSAEDSFTFGRGIPPQSIEETGDDAVPFPPSHEKVTKVTRVTPQVSDPESVTPTVTVTPTNVTTASDPTRCPLDGNALFEGRCVRCQAEGRSA